jgi:hypothetical protein
MSKVGGDIRQDLQEGHRAGDRKENNRIFDGLREVTDWTLWSRPRPKRKKIVKSTALGEVEIAVRL